MFKSTTCPKLLRKFSPIWNTSKMITTNPISTTSELPSIYELLYLNKPTEIHIELLRNTKIGTTTKIAIYFKDYITTFNFINKNYYESWVTLHQKHPSMNNYIEVANSYSISHELTYSMIRLLPKILQNPFRQLLLIENLPRRWHQLIAIINNVGPSTSSIVKTPTVFKLELLQAGAFPLQIPNSEKITKTYYYFKE